MYFNVRSLLPKIDHLRAICNLSSPDIICIVESWLDSTIADTEIFIQGYSIVRLDRSRHGGGVIIFVKSQFTLTPLYRGTPDFECLIVSIKSVVDVPSHSFTVALFYRPPNSSSVLLDFLFVTLCKSFVLSSSRLFLVGDFNIDFSVPCTCLYRKLFSVISSFNLTQVVSEPT